MTERVLELVRALGGAGQDEELLCTLCGAACRTLDQRLREGVAPEDCQEAYPLAAAWLVMDWLRGGGGLEGVTAITAGNISVRRESADSGEKLSDRAWALMRPWVRDDGFVFRGVRG